MSPGGYLATVFAVTAVVLLMWPASSRRMRPPYWAERAAMWVRRPRRIFGGTARVARERTRVREATSELVAELVAGQPLRRALLRALDDEVAPRGRAAARFGGDIPMALQEDSDQPGHRLLASVAACWSVAEGSGAGLAVALDRLVAQEREAEDIRVQLMAHLAAPRATSRMLSILPVIGLAMGFALGVDPIGWLMGSPLGLACLFGGVGLALLGLWWTSRITRRVEALL